MANKKWHPPDTDKYLAGMRKLWGGKLSLSRAPKRIQLTGRFMHNPPNSKRVMRPSRFGNPFQVEEKTPAGYRAAEDQYRAWLEDQPDLMATIKHELHGYDLICSCPLDWPCHADVLLEVAKQ